MNINKLILFFLPFLVMASAFAAGGDTTTAMNTMAEKAVKIFDGPMLKIAVNGSGIASIVYSILGGFKPGPFIGGILLLIFHALFSAYTKTVFV